MAHRWKRYREGRLYFIGGSIGAMAILWSVLVAQDRSAFTTADQAAPSSAAVASQREAQPNVAPVVHTRTRAS
jgi:hypothetical protein